MAVVRSRFRAASIAPWSPRRRSSHLVMAAVAVTGTSDALAAGELEAARDLATLIGIRHIVISTEEFANPDYVANKPDRCYHCKTELYSQLGQDARAAGRGRGRQRRERRRSGRLSPRHAGRR